MFIQKKKEKILIALSLKSKGGYNVWNALSDNFSPKIIGFLCDFCDVSFPYVLHLCNCLLHPTFSPITSCMKTFGLVPLV